ncbi:unnamed protein product [Paramecium octaurelia]|uniref:Uncharacterized protein n=1 Tax=Paramecium octaurelia TaxID=43137 RepID=A0A8S1YLR6_PAROT|nr:unnamed protein product [Paramecium octaurelia]
MGDSNEAKKGIWKEISYEEELIYYLVARIQRRGHNKLQLGRKPYPS